MQGRLTIFCFVYTDKDRGDSFRKGIIAPIEKHKSITKEDAARRLDYLRGLNPEKDIQGRFDANAIWL